MDTLIVVRHGDHLDGSITKYGRQQIGELAGQLKPDLLGKAVHIITSSAPRALETSQILQAAFPPCTLEETKSLWDDSSNRGDLKEALRLVNCSPAPATIVVTHMDMVEWLVNRFGEEVLGVGLDAFAVSTGRGWFIDCVAKTARLV